MSFYDTASTIVITCNNRLSPYVAMEVEALGYEIEETFVTGVRITGTMNDCIRLNLNLRCASQVLYRIKEFKALDADEVYSSVYSYAWEKVLLKDGHLSITSNVYNDTIKNNMYANLRVKDAIVDRMVKLTGERPNTGSELSGAVIHLFWNLNEAALFIDTSGPSLARHGYRKIPGRAPMLEALAAATILASKWDKKSPFVNPMCGSGTLAIEAALIATNTAPGLFRTNYAFMHIQGYDEEYYLEERGKLENMITDEVKGLRIIATDYDRQAIINAEKNARAAGVADLIEFNKVDFAETHVPEDGAGVVFLNPEYGERLGEETELQATYKRIGDFMKQKCGGYFGYIFTGNMELAKKIGLKANRRIEFYNSKIDCRLLEYELYAGTKRADK
ncbi:MAG: class I SAM-dependent RNA methyltransferase [Chitinophagales bacterium]|nr:class I SAM-dependent RNA methyltransferase [Chitinophagales bacterium]